MSTTATETRYRIECPIGVTFPGGTQEFDESDQPTGYALLTLAQIYATFSNPAPVPSIEQSLAQIADALGNGGYNIGYLLDHIANGA